MTTGLAHAGVKGPATAQATFCRCLDPDRARPSLAELGVEVLSAPDGLEAIAGSRFKFQSLPEADRLLAKPPVLRALNLSRTEVANVEPLKGLTGLLSLDLSRTEVASVEPLKGLT
jgi:hypothetical protein